MTETKQSSSIGKVLKSLFAGFSDSDQEANVPYQSGAGATYTSKFSGVAADVSDAKLSAMDGLLPDFELPLDRFSQYDEFSKMLKNPVIMAMLYIHCSNALAPDRSTGHIMTIKSKYPEFDKVAEDLNKELMPMINSGIVEWSIPMMAYGVHYLRPYCMDGIGITNIESSYYTLAKQVREYVRGGWLAGFTCEWLKTNKPNENEPRLFAPWSLVAAKIPFWIPDINKRPDNLTGITYSLSDDISERQPMETQNYGTSFLAPAYQPFMELEEQIRALRGARYSASRRDRYFLASLGTLDHTSSAKYLNQLGNQLRYDLEAERKAAKSKGVTPTVMNHIMASNGDKGGLQIIDQENNPNINGIEDVIFTLKRLCSSLGVSPSMIGWEDMMAGGLGEGGWTKTSELAALRSDWVRDGARNMTQRFIEIHLAYKDGKAYPKNDFPFEILLNTTNTAIAAEKAAEKQAQVDFYTALTTLLDMIMQGSMSGSDTYKKTVLENAGINQEMVNTILSELAQKPDQELQQMTESVGGKSAIEQLIRNELSNIFELEE